MTGDLPLPLVHYWSFFFLLEQEFVVSLTLILHGWNERWESRYFYVHWSGGEIPRAAKLRSRRLRGTGPRRHKEDEEVRRGGRQKPTVQQKKKKKRRNETKEQELTRCEKAVMKTSGVDIRPYKRRWESKSGVRRRKVCDQEASLEVRKREQEIPEGRGWIPKTKSRRFSYFWQVSCRVPRRIMSMSQCRHSADYMYCVYIYTYIYKYVGKISHCFWYC